MRLDHLLSKEHFLTGFGWFRGQYISECLMLVAHRWNVDYSARFRMDQALVLLFGAWNADHEWRECRARCWVSEGTAVRLPSVPAPVNSLINQWGDGWLVVV